VLRPLRSLLIAIVAWQAAVALWSLLRAWWTGPAWDVGAALTATTDERLQRTMGAPAAAMVAALRELRPPHGVLFLPKVTGSVEELQRTIADPTELVATFERLSARNGLVIQLITLTLPRPVLVSVPDPVAAVEREGDDGRELWLMVFAGDAEPEGRAGWSRVGSHPGFTTWRFRKAS
jgi:hypothetical protein